MGKDMKRESQMNRLRS